MKNLILIVAALGFMVTTACQKKLDSDIKKASYAVGQQIGKNMKQQNLDLDTEVIAMAMKDAQKGESKLKDDEIQQAMMKLQEMAMKKQQAEGEDNLKKANEFLEKNKSTQGVKVTASGLQYIVLKEGDGKTPTDEDNVKCHYAGTLVSGEKFDSSYDRNQPAEFPVRGVIPGWTEALKMMKVGGKLKLFVPPALAYGPQGRPPVIPPNSVLIFEVELMEIMAKTKAEAPKGKKK